MKRMLQQKQQREQQRPSQWHSLLSTPLLAVVLIVVYTTTTIFSSCFQSSVNAFTTTTPTTHNALHHQQQQLAKINTRKNPLSLISTTSSSIKNYQDNVETMMVMSRYPNNRVMTSLSFKDDKYGYDEEDDDHNTIMKQDWNAITTTAGNLIQSFGSKVFYFAGWIVSKLLHIISSENVISKIKDKILMTSTTTTTTTPPPPPATQSPTTVTTKIINDGKNIIINDEVDDDDDEEEDEDNNNNNYYSKLVEETANQDDEDLFRSIMGLHNNKKKGNNNNNDGKNDDDSNNHSMIDRVLNQAVSLLEQDEMATYLLGTIGTTTSSLKYSQPFSLRSEIANNNNNDDGKKTTTTTAQRTIHIRFEVSGNYGRKGIASVMSNDDTIVSLDLEIDGRMHRVKTTTTTTPKSSSFRTSSSVSQQSSSSSSSSPKVQEIENTHTQLINDEDTNNKNDYVDVEIMKGIYWPTVASLRDENIIDAEIEDKKFF